MSILIQSLNYEKEQKCMLMLLDLKQNFDGGFLIIVWLKTLLFSNLCLYAYCLCGMHHLLKNQVFGLRNYWSMSRNHLVLFFFIAFEHFWQCAEERSSRVIRTCSYTLNLFVTNDLLHAASSLTYHFRWVGTRASSSRHLGGWWGLFQIIFLILA